MARGKYAKKRSGKGGLVLLLIVTLLVVTGCVVGMFLVLNRENPEPTPQYSSQTTDLTTADTAAETVTTATTVPATTAPAVTEPTQVTTVPVEETTAPVEETTAPTVAPTVNPDAGLGEKISQTALEQLGKPYQLGGSGPDGFDPTGLVWYCLKQNGIKATRKMKQMVLEGVEVPKEELMPGDVVFFWSSNEGVVEFLGVYVGNGKFVAARNEANPVSELDMTSNYFTTRYLTARRFGN